MRLQIFGLGLLGATLLASSTVWAQQATTRPVIVQVGDQGGSPIPQAQIRFEPAPDPAPTKLETDEHGNLSINLKPGSYALFVSAQGFRKWCESIYVAKPDNEATASQLYPVVLQVGAYSGPIVMAPKDSLVLSSGAYHGPMVVSPADFRALPHITIKVHNSQTNADETYSGVLLAVLLAIVNAPIGKEFHNEALTSYLITSGSDGSVVLSLAEVNPNLHGGHVLVADARDGQSLAKLGGPYQLIVSEDKRPTRWVRNLNSISLQGAPLVRCGNC